MLKGENRIMSDLLFQNLYRIPSARACWHNYGDGYYFITICTAGRECYFGEIIPDRNGINRNHLTAIGQYADAQIRNVQSHYSFCEIPLWVVMPNHIHLIVAIDGLKTPWVKRDMVGRGGPVETFHETSLPTTGPNMLRIIFQNGRMMMNVSDRHPDRGDAMNRVSSSNRVHQLIIWF